MQTSPLFAYWFIFASRGETRFLFPHLTDSSVEADTQLFLSDMSRASARTRKHTHGVAMEMIS